LPDGFQRAEYLKDHGMIDMVVHRHDLRPTLARLCRILTKSPAMEAVLPKPAPSIDIPAPAQIPSGMDVTPVAPHA
jgi:acetyl-CoA carboxylase carboxyl transferase subunit beta